jgi:hypothetical protein
VLDGQMTLFDIPDRPVVWRKPPRTGGRPSYVAYRPRVRRLCDDCIADIHARGFGVAPRAMAVQWRRTHEGVSVYLCGRCKERRVVADG